LEDQDMDKGDNIQMDLKLKIFVSLPSSQVNILLNW